MFKTTGSDIYKQRFLFFLIIPGVLYFIVFCYIPMVGIIMAFQDYDIVGGLFRSPWVGLKHLNDFFTSRYFIQIVRNTVLLNIYGLIFGFPIPIIFAISLNEIKSRHFRGAIQTASYLPNFISNVVVVGIVFMFLSPEAGPLNILLKNVLGMEKIYFLVEPKYFRSIYTITNIWRGFGWSSVIYLSAIIGIDTALFESAIVDGASKIQQIFYITLPSIRDTIIICLILNIGTIMNSNFEMTYLLYNPLTYETGDVISTYLFRRSIANTTGFPEYSFGTAVGLFNSVVNMALILFANWTARKTVGRSIY